MEISAALERAAKSQHGVLIPLRHDGRAQSSDVVYAVIDGEVAISVTHDRAKTRNAIRDNRVIFHITDPSRWSYLSIDATAAVSPVAADPNDAVADELVAIYKLVAGEHDNFEEFRQAMVDEGRCVIRLTPQSVSGQLH